MIAAEWLPYALAGAFGLSMHWMKTMVALNQAGDVHVSLFDYLRDHKYQTVLSIGLTVMTLVTLEELGHLTIGVAMGVGYIGDSFTDLFGGRVRKMYG